MNKRNILIAVAWPYVNGELHIGHLAGYLLPADITARYHRLAGDNVLMVSGSDCHGTPITVEADKRKTTPQAIADEYHDKDVSLFKDTLHLTYDLYTRTDTPHHAKITQDFFLKLLNAGYVFIDTSMQYYSDEEKRFLPDRYIIGQCPYCNFTDARSDQCDNCGKLLDQGELIDPKSKLSSSKAYLKPTQHYFVDWSKLQPQIESYVNQVGPNWKDWVFQETKGWLAEGLKPRPITRDIDWGVTIPTDKIPPNLQIEGADHKRFYVWFDAVIGYFSASILWAEQSGKTWDSFWYDFTAAKEDAVIKHYYFMGKDNLAFHTMLWPAKLMVYDPNLHLPDVASINMFLNFDGQQFSKSRNVVIDSKKLVEKFGNDMVRFYLTYIMPETRDSSFSWTDFGQRVNNILIGNLSNFIHRTLSIAQNAPIHLVTVNPISNQTQHDINKAFMHARLSLEENQFKNYLDSILALSAYGNKIFDYHKVWALKKTNTDMYNTTLKDLYAIIVALGYLMQPLLFEGSHKIFNNLGLSNVDETIWSPSSNIIESIDKSITEINSTISPTPLYLKLSEADLNLA